MKKAMLLGLSVLTFHVHQAQVTRTTPSQDLLALQLKNETLMENNHPLTAVKKKKRRRGNDASFSMGAQLNYNMYFGGTGMKIFGLGIFGDYGKTEDVGIRGALNYYLPYVKSGGTWLADALADSTKPGAIEVGLKYKYNFYNVSLDGKKYFGDGSYEDGGLYGFLGLGLTIAQFRYEIDAYDKTKYEATPFDENSKESFIQYIIRGGLGYERSLDFASIFAEGVLNIPANNVNGQYVEIQIPLSAGLHAGIRFPF